MIFEMGQPEQPAVLQQPVLELAQSEGCSFLSGWGGGGMWEGTQQDPFGSIKLFISLVKTGNCIFTIQPFFPSNTDPCESSW